MTTLSVVCLFSATSAFGYGQTKIHFQTDMSVIAGQQDSFTLTAKKVGKCYLSATDGSVQEKVALHKVGNHFTRKWTVPVSAENGTWNLLASCSGIKYPTKTQVTVIGVSQGQLLLWAKQKTLPKKPPPISHSNPSSSSAPGSSNPDTLNVSLSTQSPQFGQSITLTISNPTPGVDYQYTWDVCSAPDADCAGITGETTATIIMPIVCQFPNEYIEGTAYAMTNGVPTQIGGATADNPIPSSEFSSSCS